MLLSLTAGLVTAAATLPAALARQEPRYWWLLATVPIIAAALHPRPFNAALTVTLRTTRRAPLAQPFPARAVLAATGWSVGSWLLFGTRIWLLLGPWRTTPARSSPSRSAGSRWPGAQAFWWSSRRPERARGTSC